MNSYNSYTEKNQKVELNYPCNLGVFNTKYQSYCLTNLNNYLAQLNPQPVKKLKTLCSNRQR